MKTVLVFKTSIGNIKHIKTLQPILDNLMCKTDNWNFDLEDCDNILRIETQTIKSNSVCKALNTQGFYCEELL